MTFADFPHGRDTLRVPSLKELHSHLADPAAWYRTLPSSPIYFDRSGRYYVVKGYDAARQALISPAFTAARLPEVDEELLLYAPSMARLVKILRLQSLFVDDPQHKHWFDVAAPAFHKHRIANLRTDLSSIVDSLLNPFQKAEKMDLAQDFAVTLPTRVSAHMLGLRETESKCAQWIRWNVALEHVLASLNNLMPDEADETLRMLEEGFTFILDLVNRVRSGYGDVQLQEGTLLDTMIRSQLSAEEIAANGLIVLSGGYQTTTQLIIGALSWIERTPGLRAFLAEHPERIQDLLKETERRDGASQFVGRRAIQDVIIANSTIPEGASVLILLAAANLDPGRFPNPYEFNIDRTPKDQLGFSKGLHHCLGEPLAMLTAEVAVKAFLERFPEAHLPTPEEMVWNDLINVRCPTRVPVTLRLKAEEEQPSAPVAVFLNAYEQRETDTTLAVVDEDKEWTEAEYHLIERVQEWQGLSLPLPEIWAHQLIEQHAVQQPAQIALVWTEKGQFGQERRVEMTYQELNERANRLAHWLRLQDVGPNISVGVCMQRSAMAVVAFLAIQKVGGIYTPLETVAVERFARMVQNAAPAVLLEQGELEAILRTALPTSVPTLVVHSLDSLDQFVKDQPAHNLPSIVSRTDLAYIIYTSGTTGEPKGVEITHEDLLNFVVAQLHLLHIRPTDKLTHVASLLYDASIHEFTLALCHGATLCLPIWQVGDNFAQYLRQECITITTLTPTVLRWTPHADLPDLRMVLSAGEACTEEIVQKWAPGRVFYNLYGPAECSVWATYARCVPEQPISIGRPIVNKIALVLDEYQRPVPIGQEGQLYLGGLGLMAGYRRAPDLTEQVLATHTLPILGTILLYATGDLAKWTPDGQLSFCGRQGDTIKVHGHRVALGEIEAALLRTIGSPAGVIYDNEQLIAFVAASDSNDASVRAMLKPVLSWHMIPHHFMFVETLPRQYNSDKLDRHALVELWRTRDHRPAALNGRHGHAKSDLSVDGDIGEKREALAVEHLLLGVIELFNIFLKRNDCSERTDFFEGGASSLSSMLLLTEVRKRYPNVTLDPTTIYYYPTPQALARYLHSTRYGDKDYSTVAVAQTTGNWIVRRPGSARPTKRLFIIPEAGVGASRYAGWRRILNEFHGEEIELCLVQLPGREERSQETAYTDFYTVVEALANEMQSNLDLPYVLFGHSLGGFIAYELVRLLHRRGMRLPLKLSVASCRAPNIPDPSVRFATLSDEDFLAKMVTLAGESAPSQEMLEGLRQALPILRADFSLVNSYRYEPEPPLPCSVSIWGGMQDSTLDFMTWRRLEPRCAVHLVHGSHFFHHQQEELRNQLLVDLSVTLQALSKHIYNPVMV